MNYLDFKKNAVEVFKQLDLTYASLNKNITLNKELVILVETFVSHLNGCPFCIDYHINDAKKNGITQERIENLLNFVTSDFYSAQEKAALAMASTLSMATKQQYAAVDQGVKSYFSTQEIVELSLVIGITNGFNRIYGFMVEMK